MKPQQSIKLLLFAFPIQPYHFTMVDELNCYCFVWEWEWDVAFANGFEVRSN